MSVGLLKFAADVTAHDSYGTWLAGPVPNLDPADSQTVDLVATQFEGVTVELVRWARELNADPA